MWPHVCFCSKIPQEMNIYIIWKFIPRAAPWYCSHGCGYYFGPPLILETVKRYMYNKYRYVSILQTGFVFYGIHRKKLHTIKISNISKYNSSISHLLFSLFQKSIVARYFSSLKNQRLTWACITHLVFHAQFLFIFTSGTM